MGLLGSGRPARIEPAKRRLRRGRRKGESTNLVPPQDGVPRHGPGRGSEAGMRLGSVRAAIGFPSARTNPNGLCAWRNEPGKPRARPGSRRGAPYPLRPGAWRGCGRNPFSFSPPGGVTRPNGRCATPPVRYPGRDSHIAWHAGPAPRNVTRMPQRSGAGIPGPVVAYATFHCRLQPAYAPQCCRIDRSHRLAAMPASVPPNTHFDIQRSCAVSTRAAFAAMRAAVAANAPDATQSGS